MEKDSFILHNDSLEILDELTDEEAGKLFKAICQYHLNINNDNYTENILKDRALQFAFKPFKNQLNRDFKKYKETIEKRRKAGAKGGKQRVANQASASTTKQRVANQADSVKESESVSDNVSVKDNDRESNKISPSFLINKYRELISNENEMVQESTSFNQIALRIKDLDKIHRGIINYSEYIKKKRNKPEKLFFFIKNNIYLDYQEEKEVIEVQAFPNKNAGRDKAIREALEIFNQKEGIINESWTDNRLLMRSA